MRASPSLQITLTRFGWWRCGVAIIAFLAVTELIAWLATRADPLPVFELALWVTALVLVVWFALASMRLSATMLRWDGQQWWIAPPGREHQAQAGDIALTIDLGLWMLLRFHPRERKRPVRWLPVQRAGLESQWHALRCAVHSPAPAEDAAGTP